MPAAKPSSADEDDFLNTLLSGLDASREPDTTTRSAISSRNIKKQSCPVNVPAESKENYGMDDISMLLDGAEDWDWDDMEADFLTPKKKLASPRKASDIINILGSFDPEGVITISSQENFFIHHPDLLFTATALSNAPQCRRKPLLSALLRTTSDTPVLIWGNMLHQVMQTCFSSQRWDEGYIDELIDDVVMESLMDLVKMGIGIDEAKREVKLRSKGLRIFSERYISQTPKADAVLTNTRAASNQTSLLAITELLDVEEDIWSPTYGLRGKLDATVQAVIAENIPDKNAKKGPQSSAHAMPFEIKTGRSIAGMEHRAQTMLYTLLAEERYGVEIPSGLLYYTQSQEVVRVPRGRNEIRGLIGARNEMAAYMMRRANQGNESMPFLPPTIDDERACKKCYMLDTCMLYRNAVDKVEDDSSPIADIYHLKTSHLTPSQADFFKHWEALIALEEQDATRFRKELWTMNAQEREDKGRCFSSMVIDSSHIDCGTTSSGPGKIHRYTYRFVRSGKESTAVYQSLLNGHLSSGDAITVSVEPELLALARGFIVDLSPQDVVVGVDHDISEDKISARLQILRKSKTPISPIFRIDKDELTGGMARIRDNLAQLFYAEGDLKRLELVVDLRVPTFEDEQIILDNLRRIPEYAAATTRLNANQLGAMTRVMSANDYALILGMPGTGKTTVIAALIRTLVGMGKTVLLASYTHSAVDTILLKLKDDDYGILRLGNVDKVQPDIRKFTLSERKTATTIEQLENQLMSPPVVATTSKKRGLETSLFRRLSEAHPHAVVDLRYQYRMNEDIMRLCNRLIYGDRLRCGSEEVARRTLKVADWTFVRGLRGGGACSCEEGKCWLEYLLDESHKAVFVDTDQIPAPDSRVGDLVQNEVEAKLLYQITQTLLQGGVTERQIGIMSLYRQQLKLLSFLLQDKKEIEMMTADKSQGRDKECIIISMVRSNDVGQVGDLLKDWRRINVSITRAKSKLIIIGSRKTLCGIELLKQFFELMDEQGWVLRLPYGAESLHPHPLLVPPKMVTATTPGRSGFSAKREADVAERENLDHDEDVTPSKKAKRPVVQDGILRGRPILKDLLNDDCNT
ncbi:Dna2-domain-containing protein [Phlebopus sp. FC_14]|nr:Dna2-domain-containing protein [Phlebopus sp. FC_14]